MTRVALIGIGRWGKNLLRILTEQCEVAYCCNRSSRDVHSWIQRRHPYIRCTFNYEEILKDPTVEGVVIATPIATHEPLALRALQAGKHVFVEKPFTLTAESAKQAVAACEQAGVILALGHNRRFFPSMIALKAMIEAGELGQVVHLEGQFSSSYGLDLTPKIWRADGVESPAGGMTSLGIHCIDAFIDLNGPISRIQAYSLKQALTVESNDTTAMLLRFENGATGLLGTLTATARLFRLQVFGTKGWVRIDEDGSMTVCPVDGQPEDREFEKSDTCRSELEAFATAVAGGEPYLLPTDEAIHGIAVLEAIVESAANDAAAIDLS